MSGHRVDWTHDGDSISAKFTCEEGPWAACRSICAVGCEQWGDVSSDGRRHSTDAGYLHEMRQTDYCNVVLFLEEGGTPEEQYDGPDTPVRSGPIVTSWDGDAYSWSYLEAVPA